MAATSYARSGDVHVAYQVLGAGPVDLVYVPGWVSHLELEMENPFARHFYERLATFSRLIRFDKRGTGMSDRDLSSPTLEARVDDIRAVMDAAGSSRAAVLGYSEGGTMAAVFATQHPERVERLVMLASHAGKVTGSPDFPCGYEVEDRIEWMRRVVTERWGEGASLEHLAPSMWPSGDARQWMARFEKGAATPGAALAHFQFNLGNDARSVLGRVQAPTLVLHRAGDHFVPRCNADHLAAAIPHAKLVIVDGEDHVPFVGDVDRVVEEIARFVTGRAHGPWEQPPSGPRPTTASVASLTPAQRRVADLVAEGLSNGEIATRLHLSRHTVESHLKHAYATLGISSRVDLARLVLTGRR